MKQFLIPSVLVIVGVLSNCNILGQTPSVINKPQPSQTQVPAATVSVETTPSAYPSNVILNHVKSFDALGPVADLNAFSTQSASVVKQSTVYIDGLGRAIQVVQKQGAQDGSAMDIVVPKRYDAYAREAQNYLPYVANTNDGNFKLSAFSEQASKLALQFPGETVFYGQTVFENSPLSRPVKSLAPGNSFLGSNRGVETAYLFNSSSDAVRKWSIGFDLHAGTFSTYLPQSSLIPVTNSVYPNGSLIKTVTTDEHGSSVIEFKNTQGQVVLKRVQIKTTATDPHQDFLNTYYVYDIYGYLRVVIQPKAVAALALPSVNWVISTEIADGLCFRYEYDLKGRMIAKKVPDADWVYMVYDSRDRLVSTQDGLMRAKGEWLITCYDALNRPVMTGLMNYGAIPNTIIDRNNLQTAVSSATGQDVISQISFQRSSPANTASSIYVSDAQVGIKSYKAISQVVFEVGFEASDGGDFSAEIVLTPPQAPTSETVAIHDNPMPSGVVFVPLTINYFDSYAFNTSPAKSFSSQYNAQLETGNNSFVESMPVQTDMDKVSTRSLPTGSRVRVLSNPNDIGSGVWLTSILFYDVKGRITQTQTDNILGGNDILTSRFDFQGKPVCNLFIHDNPQNPVASLRQIRVRTTTDYSTFGAVVEVRKTINDLAAKTIVRNTYDAYGRLIQKRLGVNPTGTGNAPIETLDYTYNIRGWLTSINKDYSRGNQVDRWFGMELSYDWGFEKSQFNGNIAGMRWRSKGDGIQRGYGFGYDLANRLMYGDFSQGSSYVDDPNVNFDMRMGDGIDPQTAYDPNGNIKRMQQWGLLVNSSAQIDDLNYTYNNGVSSYTNKLKNVIDFRNNAQTKLGDFRTALTHPQQIAKTAIVNVSQFESSGNSITDYSYDQNGNLTRDLNKDIDGAAGTNGIIYNYLNLPWVIAIKNKGSIQYTYDAGGNKLEKAITDNTNNTTVNKRTTYIGPFVYENNEIKFFSHEEGRIRVEMIQGQPSNPSFVLDYFVKDHLGNVRMVLTEQQQQQTYPMATLELSQAAVEENFYYNLETRDEKPVGYPATIQDPNNQKVSKLSGNGHKIGPAIMLKVMAGDRINLQVTSWYRTAGITPQQPTGILPSLLANLASTAAGALPGAKATGADFQTQGVFLPGITQFFNTQPATPNKPKAYLNWVLFDEQFKLVEAGSSADPVPDETYYLTNNSVYTHLKPNLPIPASGYFYVYVSNETPNINVYFDNLQVSHTRGPLVEETHYYPFGLVMSGISSKAAGKLENKRSKFNGYELNIDFDLNTYESFYRMHDPQIGRFWQIDPKPNLDMSPYSSMGNNPNLLSDPLGDTTRIMIGEQYYYLQRNKDGGISYYDNKGKMYEGELDEFSQSVLTAANSIAGIKDEEVQNRLTEVLGGKKMITMVEGIPNFDEKTGELSWSNNKDGNGIMTNNGGNIEKPGPFAKARRDSDLDLVHEWLGHGYQHSRGMLNHDRILPFTEKGSIIGWPEKVEADASSIVTRAAQASGRSQMGQPVYIEMRKQPDGTPAQMLFHVVPRGYLLTNSESQKPTNYRR